MYKIQKDLNLLSRNCIQRLEIFYFPYNNNYRFLVCNKYSIFHDWNSVRVFAPIKKWNFICSSNSGLLQSCWTTRSCWSLRIFRQWNFVQISSWWMNRTNWAVRLIHDPQTEFNTTVKAVDSLFLILTVAPLWSLEPCLKTTVFGISISVVLSLVQLNYKSGCYLRWNYFDLLKEFSS